MDRGIVEQQDQEASRSIIETTAEVESATGSPSPVESASTTKKGRRKARPKKKATQKGKPESTTSQARVNVTQPVGKASKKGVVAKDEIIDLSSDESVKIIVTRNGAMDVDERKGPTPVLGKRKATNPFASKRSIGTLLRSPKLPETDIPGVVSALHNGPPFPTILVQAADPEKRMQTAQHEARRLVCALIAVGVPMDWWMIGVTDNGFILRDEVNTWFLTITVY
jgi:hypothetical protein